MCSPFQIAKFVNNSFPFVSATNGLSDLFNSLYFPPYFLLYSETSQLKEYRDQSISIANHMRQNGHKSYYAQSISATNHLRHTITIGHKLTKSYQAQKLLVTNHIRHKAFRSHIIRIRHKRLLVTNHHQAPMSGTQSISVTNHIIHIDYRSQIISDA